MKHVSKFLLATVIVLGLYACSGDDDNGSNTQARTELYKKWIIQSTSSTGRQANAGGSTTLDVDLNTIESIEFTDEGIFIIVETDGEVTTGTYTISGSTLNLADVGTITINDLNDSMFNFTFEVSNATLNLFATPAEVIATNTSNEAFFQYWTVQNLEEFNATAQDADYQYSELNVLFTPYGTYLINGTTLNGNPYVELSYWQWKNDNQMQVCYKIEEDDEFDCDNEFFEINSLSQSQFVFIDRPGNEEAEFQFTLVPAN